MKRIKIPNDITRKGDLRMVISVGTLGFTRSEILEDGKWAPGTPVYVDEETTKVEFSIVGRINTNITYQINKILDNNIEKKRKYGKN